MKKILIVGAGACGLAISRALSAQGLSREEVVIVTPDNIDEHKDEIIAQNRQFEQQPIPFTAQPRLEEYIPTREEIQSHPFQKFIGKPRGKKR